MTDELARILLDLCGVKDGGVFLNTVHGCDFVVHRAHGWRFADHARRYLRTQLDQDTAPRRYLHNALLDYSSNPDYYNRLDLPSYLFEGPGYAFHSAELNADNGLRAYSQLGFVEVPRIGWLGSRLADDQQTRGVLPKEASQLDFLRGMVLYREGRRAEAIALLRPIAVSQVTSREVAVAAHLVGRFDALQAKGSEYRVGTKMMRRSRRLGTELGDVRHLAHVEHSLALALLRREPKSRAQALDLLARSAATAEEIEDEFGLAKILHTWGQALSRSQAGDDRRRAEAMLRRSLAIGEQLGYRRHVAAVLRTLSGVVRDPDEAARLLQRAADLE